MFCNFKFKYEASGKFIFVPTDECIDKGEKLLRFFEKEVRFPKCFYHYRRGGHVSALHSHLSKKLFFRIDIQKFFYSIARNRVASALYEARFSRARSYAKWSCVRNPHSAPCPNYCLPIGFVQSPALASLVLMRSPIMDAIARAETKGAQASIYLDDIICSYDEIETLKSIYHDILESFRIANFRVSSRKLIESSHEIIAFNCVLRNGFSAVSTDRIKEFFDKSPSAQSAAAFDRYCASVSKENL